MGIVVLHNLGESLPGATIFLKGSFVVTSTNQLGQFHLSVLLENGPVTLVVAFVGYELQGITRTAAAHDLVIALVPSAATISATVVAASRVEEDILRTSVAIDKVTAAQIERLSTPEVLAGLGQLPGVDVNSASMLFTSVSTRGFNTAKSERVIQLVDYTDTALPSLSLNLNLSPPNLVGSPELDRGSIELLHGPASALYGANALSGVVLFNSKEPFGYEDLRAGLRSLLDGQVRYAKKLGKKAGGEV